jgi:hypothetical protein
MASLAVRKKQVKPVAQWLFELQSPSQRPHGLDELQLVFFTRGRESNLPAVFASKTVLRISRADVSALIAAPCKFEVPPPGHGRIIRNVLQTITHSLTQTAVLASKVQV